MQTTPEGNNSDLAMRVFSDIYLDFLELNREVPHVIQKYHEFKKLLLVVDT